MGTEAHDPQAGAKRIPRARPSAHATEGRAPEGGTCKTRPLGRAYLMLIHFHALAC